MTYDQLKDRRLLRRRLLHLCITCVVLLALVALATVGPSDAVIAGGAR